MEYAFHYVGNGCQDQQEQNMALRVILGPTKTTPVHDTKKKANVEPL